MAHICVVFSKHTICPILILIKLQTHNHSEYWCLEIEHELWKVKRLQMKIKLTVLLEDTTDDSSNLQQSSKIHSAAMKMNNLFLFLAQSYHLPITF